MLGVDKITLSRSEMSEANHKSTDSPARVNKNKNKQTNKQTKTTKQTNTKRICKRDKRWEKFPMLMVVRGQRAKGE